jgi:hypothetical protein
MAEGYVAEAVGWADYLVRAEFRGPGDTVDAAMARCERKHKLSHSVLWGLRYRVPKDLFVSVYVRLGQAYEAEKAAMRMRLSAELRRAEQEGFDEITSPAYRFARAALGKKAAT